MDDKALSIIGFLFLTLLSIFLIYMYQYVRKREKKNLDILDPSWSMILPIIMMISGATICLLYAIGLIGNTP